MDVLFRLADSLETFHLTTWAAAHVYHTQYSRTNQIHLPAEVLVKIAAPILQKLRGRLRRNDAITPAKIVITGMDYNSVQELQEILLIGERTSDEIQLTSYATPEIMFDQKNAINSGDNIIYISGTQEHTLPTEKLKRLLRIYADKLDDGSFQSVTRIVLDTAPLERVKNIWKPQSDKTLQNWFENSFDSTKTRIKVPPVTIVYTKPK